MNDDGAQHCRGTLRWKPQEQGAKITSTSFPSVRNRGYRTSRRKETSQRYCKQCGDLHNTNSRLCPNESVRLSSSPVCCNKGLNCRVHNIENKNFPTMG